MDYIIKRTDKNNRTEVLVEITKNCYIAVTIEEASSHIPDKWVFRKVICIPSVFNRKWDNLAGEQFCRSYGSRDQAVAYAHQLLKELIEWVHPNASGQTPAAERTE